jgi:hypothetical protein
MEEHLRGRQEWPGFRFGFFYHVQRGHLAGFVAIIGICLTACGGGSGPATTPTNSSPTVTINASPTKVSVQTNVQLTWSSTNASACVAGNAWSGSQAINGSAQIIPPTASSTFTLTCSNAAGASASQSVTVTVQPPTDPVAGSVADTTLLGADANGNGIRDDVEAFITQRYSDSTQRSIMMNFAAATTKFLLATGAASALSAQNLANQASVCGQNNFGLAQYQIERIAVQAAIFNNPTRLGAYFSNQQVLDGATFPTLDSVKCSLDGSSYNGTP